MCTSWIAFSDESFDVPVPEFRAVKTDVSKANTLTGAAKAKDIISNSYYTDISGTYGHRSIVKMAAFEVVKQYGDKKYYPSQAITGYEALGMLVRLRGNEANVMQRVYAQTGSSTTPDKMKLIMNQEYLTEAQILGIIDDKEILNLNQTVTKEKIAVWISRAISKSPNNLPTTVFTYSDWATVTPVYRALIEDLTTDGIIKLRNDGSFGPKTTVSRGEMAVILDAAYETQYAARGIASGFGLVIGIKPEKVYDNGNVINRNTITVKNTDGTVTKLVSETHSKLGKQLDYVTYKNAIVSNNANIAMGDEIEYYTIGGELRFVDVLDHNLVLEKINANSSADIYTTFHYGTLIDIRTKNQVKNGKAIISEIYRVTDITGDVYDIIVDEDMYSGQRDDIITYKNGSVGGVKKLAIGDVLEYLVNETKQVLYIKVAPLDKKSISGTVREITPLAEDGPATMTIYGYDEKLYQVPLASYANLRINSRVTTLSNFVYGMPVTAEISNGYIISVDGESYSGEPGYIPKYGKMRIGKVVDIYNNSIQVELSTGVLELYAINGSTTFSKDGNVVSKSALKVGLPIKVYFDDISSMIASKIEIEAPEVLFEIIYKGKIKNVNAAKKEIIFTGSDGLSKPEYISNNDWISAESFTVDLKTNTDTEIYVGNQKLNITELQRQYGNYEAYAVVKKVYGVSTIVKLTVKTGGETLYSSTVRSADHTQNKFEIATKENFNITEGTIVIKDGLVVPNSKLEKGDTVFVVSERVESSRNAMIVKVVTPYDNIFNRIRIGAIEQVNPNTITLRNHTGYTNNVLNSPNPNESGPYNLDTDSEIIDMTDKDKFKSIKPKDFFNDSYAKTENQDKNYRQDLPGLQFKRYYTFMVVNEYDNSIIAMHLRHKGLLINQNIDDSVYKEEDVAKKLNETFANAKLSRGIVTDKDLTWKLIQITDAHQVANYTGQWVATTANISIRYTDSIIIKGNKVIAIDDIKKGDYIYTMSIDNTALVIFVAD